MKQGASSSPILFNLIIKQIIQMFEIRNLGIKVEDEFVGILAFADDIAMIANSYEQAQSMLTTLEILLNRF